MNSEDIIKAQSAMCNEMYRIFSTLIAELTDVCVRSQMDLDEYKQSLPNLAIPNTLIEEFEEKRKSVLFSLIQKTEKAASLFPIIDYVDEALKEIEDSVNQLEKQCDSVVTACQDRRPKKSMSLFNKKTQTGTDVPPPTWSHPDYIFNVDSMITKLKQIKDVSDASMQRHIQEATINFPVSSNKQYFTPC
ncbi:hypothetical protein JH06_0503 [Blastocystis sp. subtype 4]|uniref:hypothetical protein n=1 Tax=Blastocystis sp. subtype 4 TaxID=944170 RepID=UPI00071157EB|nr:hypothetical protein JH06_0503 [Blastocystis sp. subtype 4]KNB45892.1 hypothetical protein JH06_0503 [Blastocystis sp. subtype 4]|eukprot:XP_014529335.1 hypothetical protein JH06_0503 [Blastocystis sp. subtype 4]